MHIKTPKERKSDGPYTGVPRNVIGALERPGYTRHGKKVGKPKGTPGKHRFTKGEPGSKKSMKLASTYEANRHTFWCRNDIWSAVEFFVSQTGRTKRSVVEEALYNFLLKENRVDGDNLGEEEENSSWVEPNE